MVLLTGFYQRVLQAVLKSKLNAAAKAREEEEEKREISVKELKQLNAQKDRVIEKLEDELRAARILAENGDSGDDYVCVCLCMCVRVIVMHVDVPNFRSCVLLCYCSVSRLVSVLCMCSHLRAFAC